MDKQWQTCVYFNEKNIFKMVHVMQGHLQTNGKCVKNIRIDPTEGDEMRMRNGDKKNIYKYKYVCVC